jgi:dTDP-4-amino-4,6-dideoxygalactose transaminase
MKIKYPWFKPLLKNKEIKTSVAKVIKNNLMTMGEKTSELEKKLSKSLGVKYVILTTSGTSALMMATLALNLKRQDKVLCPNLTWVATINPVRIIGSKIILIDTQKNSEKIDYNLLNTAIKKNKPKIVFLVHLNGQVEYNKTFNYLKNKFKFKVIEDAAQSLFVKDKGKFSGTLFDIGCFSLSITKPLNMIYGGFCATNNKKTADKLTAIRNNGVNSQPENSMLELASNKGLNLKPSDLHSTVGIENLKLKNIIFKKITLIHKYYEKKLKNPNLEFLKVSYKNSIPIYPQVIVKKRIKFYNYCKKRGIQIHFGIRSLNNVIKTKNKKKLKNSIYISDKMVRLPCGPGYTLKEINKVVNVLNGYK